MGCGRGRVGRASCASLEAAFAAPRLRLREQVLSAGCAGKGRRVPAGAKGALSSAAVAGKSLSLGIDIGGADQGGTGRGIAAIATQAACRGAIATLAAGCPEERGKLGALHGTLGVVD